MTLTQQSCKEPQSLAGPYPEVATKATECTWPVSAASALAEKSSQNIRKPSEETFEIIGFNLQQGQVWIDGPLVVVGAAEVNPAGNLIRKDWS